MIQLATDPNANRAGWRSATPTDAAKRTLAPSGRGGHPWPFLSKLADRPAASEHGKSGRQDGGS